MKSLFSFLVLLQVLYLQNSCAQTQVNRIGTTSKVRDEFPYRSFKDVNWDEFYLRDSNLQYTLKGQQFISQIKTAEDFSLQIENSNLSMQTDDVQEILRARSAALVNAEQTKDIQKALSFYAEDAVIQAAGMAQFVGLDSIRTLYSMMFEKMSIKETSSSITNLTVARSCDMAYEYGINRLVFNSPRGELLDMGKYILIWKKIKDNWYVAALSFTSDAPSPVSMNKNK